MRAAGSPRRLGARQPMLVVDPSHALHPVSDSSVGSLADVLDPGDVVVLNDAATIPASLLATTLGSDPVELRLTGSRGLRVWGAIALGAGDWRIDTDARPNPPALPPGTPLRLPDGTVALVAASAGRHLQLDFVRDLPEVWNLLYRHGRPIQYAYADRLLRVADVQTPLAGPPAAVEMPSAARPLSMQTLLALRRRGTVLARLTHAAGLSATGDHDLDRALPLPERYEIPVRTVDAIAAAHQRGHRVLAIGTSVVRALEGAAHRHGDLRAGPGETDLVIRPGFVPQVVDGLLSGIHERATSHRDVLEAFAPAELLDDAEDHAREHGYLIHEFGDSTLVWPGAAARLRDRIRPAA